MMTVPQLNFPSLKKGFVTKQRGQFVFEKIVVNLRNKGKSLKKALQRIGTAVLQMPPKKFTIADPEQTPLQPRSVRVEEFNPLIPPVELAPVSDREEQSKPPQPFSHRGRHI
jgi:hypothetical protein